MPGVGVQGQVYDLASEFMILRVSSWIFVSFLEFLFCFCCVQAQHFQFSLGNRTLTPNGALF